MKKIAVLALIALCAFSLSADAQLFRGKLRGRCGAGGCGSASQQQDTQGFQGYQTTYYQTPQAYYAQPAFGNCVNGVCVLPQAPAVPRLPQAPLSPTSMEFEEIRAIRAAIADINVRLDRLEARLR